MFLRYAMAFGAAAVAFGLTRILWPFVEPAVSPLFLAAVVLSAWFGGLGPGLVTAGLAVLTKLYFFVAPVRSFQAEDVVSVVHLALFVAISALISSLSEAQRRAQAETVSHELRTPLQALASWSKLLHRDEIGADQRARVLAGMDRSIAAQGRLIEDLLDVSRVVAGTLQLRTERVELGPVVEAAVRRARAAASAPDVSLHLHVDASTTFVYGDADRIEQVVCNLVSNALKFTPAGGRVGVRVEGTGSGARIVVADTGCGIQADVLPRIFEEFRQGSDTATERPQGLGLGLAIVRRLVELHGGAVSAQSDGPGRGATFVVTLPANAPARAPRSGPRAGSRTTTSGR